MNYRESREVPSDPGVDSSQSPSFALIFTIVAVLAVGCWFSFLPYFLWWRTIGHFVYIADKDNEFYLQFAAGQYYGNALSMRDVASHSPTMFQALQFIPFVLVARLLGLRVLQVNVLWHLWAAVALPLSLYVVFCHWLRRPWAATICVLVMVADCGVLTASPIAMQAVRSYQAAVGHLPVLYDGQDLLGQWRIIDPAVGIPLLILQIFLVSLAVEESGNKKLAGLAGLSSALMFYVWFYYWTAMVGALMIAFILDRSARRVYAWILAIGVIGGLPAIIEGISTRASLNSEALQRIGYFAPVPRLAFLLLPKAGLIVLLITGVWVWRQRNPRYLYLWCLALAALALSNNHIILGMDLRAGHWRYVWGTSLTILLLVMVTQFLLGYSRWWGVTAFVMASIFALFELVTGTVLRAAEVDRAINSRRVLATFEKIEAQGLLKSPSLLAPNKVVAGDDDFCALASIVSGVRPLAGYAVFMSQSIDDGEWELREALNARLEGQSKESFQNQAVDAKSDYGWGQSANPRKASEVEAGMAQAFASLDADPRPQIEEFGVDYVVLRSGWPEPDYLKRGWSLIQAGPHWRIWKKNSAFSALNAPMAQQSGHQD